MDRRLVDLNDLRVFERVARLGGFSAAARTLKLPKSSVSRSVGRLEASLAVRLLQRTTRDMVLTEPGSALLERCGALLSELDDTLESVSSHAGQPRGHLRVSAGTGFGVNVLADLLPSFLARHPDVTVALRLSSQPVDPIVDGIDVAIRMGAVPDMQAVVRPLGALRRYLCASSDYVERRGLPGSFDDLDDHDMLELVASIDKAPYLTLSCGDERFELRRAPRVSADCALTIYRLVLNGSGIGPCPAHRCIPEIRAGRLVRLFPEWELPAVPIQAIFPSRRQLAPTVRAFVDFMVEHCRSQFDWQASPSDGEPDHPGTRAG